jgi:drug/metabolite transporter (DMT)-like permease
MMAGFFGVAVYSVLLIGALELAEPRAKAQIMLLNYLWPIWVMLLSTMLLGQGANFSATSIGAVLGLAGIILPLNFGQFVQSPSRIVPYAMAGAGSFCWAGYSVLLRRWKIPEQQTGVAFHLAACAVTAAAVSRWQLFPSWEVWLTTPVICSVLFTGVGPVGFAYYAWEIAMKRGQVQFLAQLACMIPVASAGLIAVLYRETWTPRLLPAACFVALGCWIARRATVPNGIDSCDDSPS